MSTDAHLLGRRIVYLTIFVAVCAVIFLRLLSVSGGLSTGASVRVEAVVPSAVQLVPQADVRSAGVRVGRVTGISHRGPTAVLALRIDADEGPVHRDARVRVRAKTVVGENYVDLDRGTSAAGVLPDGGRLPVARADDAVQLDEILSTLDGPRRERLGRLVTGLGEGLEDADEVNALVESLSGVVEEAVPVFDVLADERRHTARLVEDLGTVFGALGERGDAIRRLAREGRATARAVAAEESAIRATLRELPPTLRTTRTTTARLADVGERAGPLLDDLTVTLDELTPVVGDLPRTGEVTLRALRRLRTVTPPARRAIDALRRTADPLRAVMEPLDGVLQDARPALAHVAPHSRDAASLFATLRAAADSRDATSHTARVIAYVSASALVPLSDQAKAAFDALEGLGLARLLRTGGVNPYAAPGSGSSPRPLAGPYPRVERDGAG